MDDLKISRFCNIKNLLHPFVTPFPSSCSVLHGMQKNWMMALLEQDGMDVWGTKPDGSIDIRMNKYLFQELQHLFPGCVTMIEDVEAYVKEAERQIFQVKAQTSDWFESYVSIPLIKLAIKEAVEVFGIELCHSV